MTRVDVLIGANEVLATAEAASAMQDKLVIVPSTTKNMPSTVASTPSISKCEKNLVNGVKRDDGKPSF